MSSLDRIPDRVWDAVVLGTVQADFSFLAIKVALTRFRLQARGGPAACRGAGQELKALFARYGSHPQASADLAMLLQKAGTPA